LRQQNIGDNAAVRDFFTHRKANQTKIPPGEIHSHDLQMVDGNGKIECRKRDESVGRNFRFFPGLARSGLSAGFPLCRIRFRLFNRNVRLAWRRCLNGFADCSHVRCPLRRARPQFEERHNGYDQTRRDQKHSRISLSPAANMMLAKFILQLFAQRRRRALWRVRTRAPQHC